MFYITAEGRRPDAVKERAMQRAKLAIVRRDRTEPESAEPAETGQEPPLVHLRITGRHGVFVLQQGAEAEEQAVVDTRPPGGARCTCAEVRTGECRHIALLRACGFLPQAA